MKVPDQDRRLGEISTMWTMLQQAHGRSEAIATPAQAVLVQRYFGAVYHYLLGAVRDPDTAAELSQEFVLRFLQGRFRHADPGRGRFRDYLKTALIHMVDDHRGSCRESPRPLPLVEAGRAEAPPEDPAPERDFLAAWREELLDRTWEALALAQPSYHAVLRMRVEDPDLTSAQMAERLAPRLGADVRPDRIRKALQRAHERFADLLLEEVQRSLDDDDGSVEDELAELDLLKYCRSALQRWQSQGGRRP